MIMPRSDILNHYIFSLVNGCSNVSKSINVSNDTNEFGNNIMLICTNMFKLNTYRGYTRHPRDGIKGGGTTFPKITDI